jgi:hypothetical protein
LEDELQLVLTNKDRRRRKWEGDEGMYGVRKEGNEINYLSHHMLKNISVR